MSADSKNVKRPSLIGVYFYGVIMALLGAVLGFAYLSVFSAQAYSSESSYQAAQKDKTAADRLPSPANAYYIEGPVLRTRSWEAKRDQLEADGSQLVTLSSGEINAWMTAKFRAASADDASGSKILVEPGVPNIAFGEDGAVYINIPTIVRAYGRKHEFTYSTRGRVGPSGYVVEDAGVSAAKVPLPSVLGLQLLSGLSQGYRGTKEYTILSGAFQRAETVEVSGDEITFKLR